MKSLDLNFQYTLSLSDKKTWRSFCVLAGTQVDNWTSTKKDSELPDFIKKIESQGQYEVLIWDKIIYRWVMMNCFNALGNTT